MNEVLKSDDTMQENIQNSLPEEAIKKPNQSAKSSKKKPQGSSGIVSPEEEDRFSLLDLKSLFLRDKSTSVWDASPDIFNLYVQPYCTEISGINTALWPLMDRLFVVNLFWQFCEKTGNKFPFEVAKILTPEDPDS